MATNINYSIGVSTAQGVQALTNLQNKVQQTNSAFAGMKSALLGFATAGFIGSLYKMANELTDMAAATGVSTQAILGFSSAVSANGGSMDGATKAIGKFVTAIDGAASGSKELQDTFSELGVSLGDLGKLSEEDLLKKTLDGLSKISDASKRVAAGVKLFGKEFRSVDVKSVADQYDYFLKKAGLSAEAVQAAGDASQNFSNSFKILSTQILNALLPISKLANAILSTASVMEPLIKLIVGLGASFLIFTKVIPMSNKMFDVFGRTLAASGGGIEYLKKQLLGVGAGFTGFLTNLGKVNGGLGTSFGGVASLSFAFSGLFRGLLRFAGIAGVLYTIFDVISSIIKSITGSGIIEWGEKALVALGIMKETSAQTEEAEQKKKKLADANREVADAMKQEKIALEQLLQAYKRSNDEADRKMKNDIAMIGMSEDQKLAFQTELAAYDRYITEYNKLKDDFDKKSKSSSPSERGMAGEINKGMKELTAEYEKGKKGRAALSEEQIKATRAERFALDSTKALQESQSKLRDLQDEIAKSTLSEIEKKYYDIDAAARNAAISAIQAEEATRGPGVRLSTAEAEVYFKKFKEGTDEQKRLAKEQYDASRQFSTGWSQAFNEYVDNATNAAQQAQRIFQAATQGMEDLLMNFFKTGKFGWRDFVQNIIDVMMRSQIQQLIAKTFGGIGSVGGGGGGRSGGGLFGGALIPGFLAEGGPAGAGKPYIVGERGPELFVPNSSGTVVPNGALGGSQVTYNINAVDAMSFKQMLAADPTFLHAVAEQGRRRLPGAR